MRRRLGATVATLAVGCGGLAVTQAATTGAAAGSGAASAATSARRLFVADCGSCHTLKAAHTRSAAGPNLDRRFRRTKRSKIRPIVLRAIRQGDGAMPAGILTGRRARSVAAYVAAHTGRR
jgi:mono/diheme cytochrome c family protein